MKCPARGLARGENLVTNLLLVMSAGHRGQKRGSHSTSGHQEHNTEPTVGNGLEIPGDPLLTPRSGNPCSGTNEPLSVSARGIFLNGKFLHSKSFTNPLGAVDKEARLLDFQVCYVSPRG